MRAVRFVLGAAGIALGVLAYHVQIDNLASLTSPAHALAIVGVAWAFLGAGLIAWARRPENPPLATRGTIRALFSVLAAAAGRLTSDGAPLTKADRSSAHDQPLT